MRLLNLGTTSGAVIGAFSLFGLVWQNRVAAPFLLGLLATLLVTTHRKVPYTIRAALFTFGFLATQFIAALQFGLVPGTILSGLTGIILAGLLFSPRVAGAAWVFSGGCLAAGLWLQQRGYGHFDPSVVDPRDPAIATRFVFVYLFFSFILCIGTAFVVQRLSETLTELRGALKKATRAQRESEQATQERESAIVKMVEAQKFEVMAQLSGSVAHDVNNSLQVVMAHAELVAEDEDVPTHAQETAAEIMALCGEAAQVARQVLTLGQRVVLDPEVTRLGKLVGSMRRTIERSVGAGVKLEFDVVSRERALVDRVQIKQALLNLVLNADHAMEGKGCLTISVQDDAETPGERTIFIRVSDTGVGMDEETQQRVLEPFFTTKGAGGSGLGLPAVLAICDQHDGVLEVQSRPGQGSSFVMRFPLVSGVESGSGSGRFAPVELTNKTILVVDDDIRVRRAIGRMLRRVGAQIIEASDGDDAWQCAQEHEGHIDLLCTDAIMPGLPVKDLIERFQKEYPRTPVLVCSAYVAAELLRHGLEEHRYEHLQKPFSTDQLLARVNRAMTRAPLTPSERP